MAVESQLGRAERWALALFGLAGAVFLPEALNRFLFAKLVVVAAAVALALAGPARGRLPRAAVVLLALAGLDLLVAALVGARPLLAVLGRSPRYEGALVLSLYLGAAVAGARLLGPSRPAGAFAWFADWLAVAALAIGALAILETAGLRPLTSNVARPGSLLGNASDEGAWALLALGPLTVEALRGRGALHVAGIVGAIAALVCSGSRGALVGAVVTVAVLLALALRREQRLAILGLAVVAAALAFAIPTTRSRVLGTTAHAAETVSGRGLLWHETLSLVGDNPLGGAGPSGFLDAIPRYHDRHYAREVGAANPPDSPHDWLLQAAVAGGLPLALLAVALAGMTLLAGARGARGGAGSGVHAGALAGLAGYATALLFHFTSPGTTPLAALLAGAALARPPSATERGTARRLAMAASVALALVLTAAAVAELPLRSARVAMRTGNAAAADHDFHLAADLRPWDSAVAMQAANTFAILAAAGVPDAADRGASWSRRALDADPRSVAALADAATIDLGRGRPAAAAALLGRALRIDPTNAYLYLQAAAAARALHRGAQAAAYLLAAQQYAKR